VATVRKGLLAFAFLFVAGTIVLVVGPVTRCAYKHYAFAKNIRVQVETTSCHDVTTEPVSGPCRCIFSFEGERDAHAIRFMGGGLQHNFDAGTGAFSVTGTGFVTHKGNVIKIDPTHVFFNDQQIPLWRTPARVLVKENGSLVSGYCEPRW
jgi:hypothetical protein